MHLGDFEGVSDNCDINPNLIKNNVGTDNLDNTIEPRELRFDLLPMDRWNIAKYNEMFQRYTNYLNKYEIGKGLKEAEKFFWNFCDNYIEIIKNRLYKPDIYGEVAKKSGQIACYKVLLGILKCFAIYIPHITEEVYKNFYEKHENHFSIHLTEIAPIEEGSLNDIITLGDRVVDFISQVRKYKSEHNISLKTELDEIKIYAKDVAFVNSVSYDIKATCHALDIKVVESDVEKVEI